MSWHLLADLALRERELVAEERWDDLLALQTERQQLIDSLPRPLPRQARSALVTARLQSRETEQALQTAMARTGSELATLRRGRRVVGAYRAAART
jgi:Flagellar protein FliT